jgi:predicted nucleic acid-binding protein
MPTSRSSDDRLVDTSVALAVVVADHQQHLSVTDALVGRRLGLAGHAAFETFSILTRLPGPARRSAEAVGRLLTANFPATRVLGGGAALDLLDRLGPLGVSGGSVYDALVAFVAAEHDMTLVTRDRRAVPTYRALEVDLELLP